MKIAIDCADLDHNRIDGTRVYIKNLLSWFGKIDAKNKFLLYHKKDFNPLLAPPKFSNYIEQKIPYPFWWTQTRLAFELKKSQPDVCWIPIQQIPFIGPKETKYVVTIHDLAFKFFPKHFPLNDRVKINFFTDTAVKRADKLIAISHSTKKDILKLYPKLKEDKIVVIHHGFDQETFSKEYSQVEITKTLVKYGITNEITGYELPVTNYLLYVGAIQPRKDLVTLVKAFNELKTVVSGRDEAVSRLYKNNLKLVIAGEAAWKTEKVMQVIGKSAYKKDLVLTGRVDFKDLAKLYQGANVFVFPSLYEGFGIPLLEAFASRTPVVAAKNSSLEEVGGAGARYFESGNYHNLSKVLREVLESSIIKKEMIKKGLEQCQKFSWEKCARETLGVMKNSLRITN